MTVAVAAAITLVATIAIAVAALVLGAMFVRALRAILVAAFAAAFRDARLLVAELTGHHRGVRLAVEALVAILAAVAVAAILWA